MVTDEATKSVIYNYLMQEEVANTGFDRDSMQKLERGKFWILPTFFVEFADLKPSAPDFP